MLLHLFIFIISILRKEFTLCAPSTGPSTSNNEKEMHTTFMPNLNSTQQLSTARLLGFTNPNPSSIVVFPEDSIDEQPYQAIGKLKEPPKCAHGSTFCEELDDYPYQYVRRILNAKNVHRDMFGIDEGLIEHRIGDFEDNFLCKSINRLVFPKAAKNINNEWKFIINQGSHEEYVQGIRIETCDELNEPCKFLNNAPYGYSFSCKQKYIYRRLVSLTDGHTMPDTFQLPSACCCAHREDLTHLRNRSGS